jgi:hypothetical protein
VNPGDTVRAYLWFLCPELLCSQIAPGQPFLIREGNRVVGYGPILRIIELEKSAGGCNCSLSTEPPFDLTPATGGIAKAD